MKYRELLVYINELRKLIQSELHDGNESITNIHNKEVLSYWRAITKALNEYYSIHKIDFESMVVNISDAEKNHYAINEENDNIMINLFKFYNIVYHPTKCISVGKDIAYPDFTLFLPCINKYFFVKYIDEKISDYSPSSSFAAPYFVNSIFIHCDDKKIMMHEFEMQLLTLLTNLVESKFQQLREIK